MAIGYRPLPLSVPPPYRPYESEWLADKITTGVNDYYWSLPTSTSTMAFSDSHTTASEPNPYSNSPTPMEHSDFKLGMKLVVNTDDVHLDGLHFSRGDTAEVVSIYRESIGVRWLKLGNILKEKNPGWAWNNWGISSNSLQYFSPYKSFSTSPTPMKHSDIKVGMKLKIVSLDNDGGLNGRTPAIGDKLKVMKVSDDLWASGWGFLVDGPSYPAWGLREQHLKHLSPISSPQNFMGNVISKVRNLTKSKSDKLYLKHGFKDQCGDWTMDARDAYVELKLDAEHKEILLPKVEEIDKEEKEEKCSTCK